LKLYAGGYLPFYLPGRKSSLEIFLSEPTLLKEVLARLGVPLEEVYLAAVNGELVEIETAIVRDEDRVRVFSAVNGG
jgi:sulfur carrier protein ThiS